MNPRSPLFWLLLASPALSQGYDIVPSYHPDGPGSNLVEMEMGSDVTFEFTLPGLDHAASLLAASTHINYLAVSSGLLGTPFVYGPNATLFLDPSGVQLFPIGNDLSLPINLANDPTLAGLSVPTQVIDVDVLDPALELFMSPLLWTRLIMPIPEFGVEMLPLGSLDPGTDVVAFDPLTTTYTFTHTPTSGAVTQYAINIADPSVLKGTMLVVETTSLSAPSVFGGFHYDSGGTKYTPQAFENFGTHTFLGHSQSGNTVRLDYQDDLPAASGSGTTTHTRAYEFTLIGKSLQVHAFQTDAVNYGGDGYWAFGFGNKAAFNTASTWEPIRVPFMDQIGVSLLDKTTFFESFIDLYRSSAQHHFEAGFWTFANLEASTERMNYGVHTDGNYKTIDETGWLTVSDKIEDVFVKTNQPKGIHADKFSNFVGVAFTKELGSTNNYNDALENITRMQSWGMKDVLMWKTHWMHFGQNRRAPTHVPADPAGGTDAEFAAVIQKAVTGGWRTALYSDFFSLDQAKGYDNNPNYSEIAPLYINYDDAVKDGDGNYRLGYSIGVDVGHGELYNTRLLAPRRSLKHFAREAAHMTSVYGINAHYFDVMTISSPDLIVTGIGQNQGVISGDHRSPNDSTIAGALNSYTNLFRGAASTVNGPVIGESSFWLLERRWDSFYMGALDGAWRTLSTGGPPGKPGFSGEEYAVIPDFEVNVVRPVMPGLFGMGQYNRFLKGNSYPVPYADAPLYEYRATEISYGHNGYMMTLSLPKQFADYISRPNQVKEYYSMRGIPDEWNASTHCVVAYRDGALPGAWMDLTNAYKTGLDMAATVLRMTYDNGLVVYVNHSPANVTEAGKILPYNGWYASNPATGFLAESIIDPTSGTRMDHVITPDYEMADGNGVSHNFGGSIGTTTNLKVVIFSPAKTLTEQPGNNVLVQ